MATSQPDTLLPYPQGVWHYARGMALAGIGQFQQASEYLAELEIFARDPALAEAKIWDINSLQSVLNIAVEVLAGEIAARQGDYPGAIAHLERAVRLEDALTYNEPADWDYPVRHSLGAVLLEAGRPAEAERVYRQDLARNPDNGWALFGLSQALNAQGRDRAARRALERFDEAWQHADVALTSSRF